MCGASAQGSSEVRTRLPGSLCEPRCVGDDERVTCEQGALAAARSELAESVARNEEMTVAMEGLREQLRMANEVSCGRQLLGRMQFPVVCGRPCVLLAMDVLPAMMNACGCAARRF